jgi:dolichol-phosphate mannosyltransferase
MSPLKTTPGMTPKLQALAWTPRLRQFARYCVVGGSGVVVDMAVLHCLACRGWNVSLSKLCSAETAMLNNFLWNELWTFSREARGRTGLAQRARRLFRFHIICGAGIGLAVWLLHTFRVVLGLDLYAANFLAILLVTLWNFWLNARFNWHDSILHGGSR